MTIKQMIKYREIWMGFAMLWIMIFHFDFSFPIEILNNINKIGYGGVDIFLFASGIGNYYSYIKDEDPLSFIKRRLSKLAPIYIPFIILWIIYKAIQGQVNIFSSIGNIFAIQGFSSVGISFNWFLTILIVCYLLTPYLATYVKKHNINKNIVLVMMLVLVSTAFFNDTKFLISATRLPIYTIGMIFAKFDSQIIKKQHICWGGFLFCLNIIILSGCYIYFPKYMWSYGLYWYPFIFITPFLCFIISYISLLSEKHKPFTSMRNCLKLVGKYSFELYLMHIFIFKELPYLWNLLGIEYPTNSFIRIFEFITSFLGAWFLNVASNKIKKLIPSKKL